MSEKHKLLKTVLEHEKEGLVSVADKLRIALGLQENPSSEKTKRKIKKDHQIGYTSKPQHGLISRKQQRIDGFNEQYTNSWLNKLEVQAHAEGYICAIQEQEIYTEALKAKREHPNDASFVKRCRHYNKSTEDIFHILGSCEALSASLYLPVRHNEVAKVVYNTLIKIYHPDEKYIRPCDIWRGENAELWWDYSIKTTPQVKHNKPGIVLWVPSRMKCFITDVCVPLEENIQAQEKEKNDKYTQLKVALIRLYPSYEYNIVPIVLGAMGLVTSSLVENLETLGLTKQYIKGLIPKLQQKALIGSMRIVKSAMTMKKK